MPADLNGADWDCCPTRVIPGTFRACRQPNYKEIPGETRWQGRTPLAHLLGVGSHPLGASSRLFPEGFHDDLGPPSHMRSAGPGLQSLNVPAAQSGGGE